MSCIVCASEIITNVNDSEEHIIPNAIGGIKKVKGFICRTCNSTAGENWDNEVAEQLTSFCNMLNINRDRGEVQDLIVRQTNGNQLILKPNGVMHPIKPEVKIDGGVYDIQARDKKEARKILTGLYRKHKKDVSEISEIVDNLPVRRQYLDSPLHFRLSLGGTEAGRSYVKSALALIHSQKNTDLACDIGIAYLNNSNHDRIWGYYLDEIDVILNRDIDIPLHCVHINANGSKGKVIAYIEYFSILKVVILLSNNYSGIDQSITYALDPTTGKELNVGVESQNLHEIIHDIISDQYRNYEVAKNNINNVLRIIDEKAREQELSRIVERIFNEISKEEAVDQQKVSQIVQEQAHNFFLHLLKR